MMKKTKRMVGVLMVAATVFSGATGLRAADQTAPNGDAQSGAVVATEGTVEGVLTAKSDNSIDVKTNDGKETHYRVLWVGGLSKDGGGYDASVAAAIKKLRVPNRVRLTWKTSEGPRVLSVEMIEPKARSGQGFGIVTAKGEKWIEIQSEGMIERLWPRWIGGMPKDGGGLDKDILRAIAARQVGDKVRFEWLYNERKRVTVLVPDERK